LDDIEQLNKNSKTKTRTQNNVSEAQYAEQKTGLEQKSRSEIEALVDWCVQKFGTEKYADATKVWVQPGQEHREIQERMTTGGEGYRKF